MENEKRVDLAARLLAAGALTLGPEPSLRWSSRNAVGDEPLRRELALALAELVREHYSAAEALIGDEWAEVAGELLGLPPVREALPDRPVLILGSAEEICAYLPELITLRRSGGSPAIAVIWNGGDEDLRRRLDRADIRCHWLTDLESAAAAALQSGALDFDDYCHLLPLAQ